jgi:hypothetical protein
MSARYGRKLDANHQSITNMLRMLGAQVETIQGPAGTPDLVVRIFNVERLCEVKPLGEKLNENQRKWWGAWGREATILRTTADCEAFIATLRGQMTRSEVHAAPKERT